MTIEKDNRVLSRRGARIVNEKEASLVNGAGTQTVCTFDPTTGPDGDFKIGEC